MEKDFIRRLHGLTQIPFTDLSAKIDVICDAFAYLCFICVHLWLKLLA